MSYYETERDKAIIASLKEIGSQLKQINEAISKEQSEGEWLPTDHLPDEDGDWTRYACSLCGHNTESYYLDTRDIKGNFCPNCGARMKGGAE